MNKLKHSNSIFRVNFEILWLFWSIWHYHMSQITLYFKKIKKKTAKILVKFFACLVLGETPFWFLFFSAGIFLDYFWERILRFPHHSIYFWQNINSLYTHKHILILVLYQKIKWLTGSFVWFVSDICLISSKPCLWAVNVISTLSGTKQTNQI